MGRWNGSLTPSLSALTPTYGFGTGGVGRTAAGMLISGPRTNLGNAKRIYAFYARRGQGQNYINYILNYI
jgi:hypothetical protein